MIVTEEQLIHGIRERIDLLDDEIIRLLHERAAQAKEIGRLKRTNGLPALDAQRERAVLERLSCGKSGLLQPSALKHIFTEIIAACRAIQEPLKVSHLGPEATFTHMAAMDYFGRSCEFFPRDSIVDVFRDVQSGHAHFGVAPVENSTEGSVGLTLDQLADGDLKICGEIYLRISHALMSTERDLSRIKEVLSHPQALGQCLGWLSRNLPARPLVQMSSTAVAAKKAAEQPGSAAVGNEALARLHGLHVLARGIQDRSTNVTRFLVLGNEEHAPTGRDKTSILFSTPHRPGALLKALTPFSQQGVNISRIESRPSKETPWEYIFFADFEGHVSDEHVRAALEEFSQCVNRLRMLGSYPAGDRAGRSALSLEAVMSASGGEKEPCTRVNLKA
ncbi:MAG: prephenate dehydratase [Deltaproteobacteria bacterium]|nr:prephenate dehydratase [Deltaproteobacteria bacterium]